MVDTATHEAIKAALTKYQRLLDKIVVVLKTRFPNLTVAEVNKLASDIAAIVVLED